LADTSTSVDSHRGRGLKLIRAIMACTEIDAHPSGTTLRLRTHPITPRHMDN
jgi:hypothetical protein